jgi:hypothetical protein
MRAPTLEQVFHDAQQLPIADQQLLVELSNRRRRLNSLRKNGVSGPSTSRPRELKPPAFGRRMKALMISSRRCADGVVRARENTTRPMTLNSNTICRRSASGRAGKNGSIAAACQGIW